MAFSLLTLVLLEAVGASSAFGLVLVQLNTDLCELGSFVCSPAQGVPKSEAQPYLGSLTTAGTARPREPEPKTARGE